MRFYTCTVTYTPPCPPNITIAYMYKEVVRWLNYNFRDFDHLAAAPVPSSSSTGDGGGGGRRVIHLPPHFPLPLAVDLVLIQVRIPDPPFTVQGTVRS